jgi:hypothetical protein
MSVYRVGGNKSSQNVFPSVRPTLDLDFANSKTLDPRITFTRSSGGSYVGADGLIKYAGVNEARFDHDPETGESLGLLVEEARTNLLLRSEEFDNSYWSKTRSSVSTVTDIISPDNTLTAAKMYPNTESGQHSISRLITGLSDNTVYTTSIFIKKFGGFPWCRLTLRSKDGTFTGVYFNYDTKTFGISIGGSLIIGFGYQEYPNGWIRLHIVTNVTTGASTPEFLFWMADSNGVLAFDYTGGNSDGFYLWGAQLEQGAFPTSYIPTQASTRTRAADNASITGKNFSEWYRQDEGTVYSNITVNEDISSALFSKNHILFSLNDGSLTNRIALFANNNSRSLTGRYYALGNTFSLALTNLSTSKFMRTTYSFKLSDIQLSNSSARSRSFPPYYPIVNRLELGNQLGSNRLNGHISRLTYFPKRLPNEQLIALTR